MSKICFIVGHGQSKDGGYDPGAVSGNHHEFKIAKKIAKFAQTYYNSNYTEQADCMNYDGDLYISERITKVNATDYDFIAEIHLNAGGGTGTECYYSKGDNKGKSYAQAISKAIATAFGVKNRGAKTKVTSSGSDYFGIIRQTKPTAVLIETLFIDTADVGFIDDTAGQQKCGEAIAKAVAEVRGAKKKSATPTKTTKPTTTTSTKKPTAVSKQYFRKYTGNSSSIVDGLVAVGANISFAYRKKIAEANGVKGYIGTATQNMKLLKLLKQGKLIMP